MVHPWEPGTQYNYNDVVCYHGHNYKIIQPHRSQGDWAPDKTPALWGRMQDGDDGGHHGGGGHGGGHQQQQHQQQQQQQQQPWSGGGAQNQQQPPQQGGYGSDQTTKWNEHSTQSVDIHEHEQKKNWYDIPPERRQELEVGGGLLAGAAALAGGYMAYQHHKTSEEDQKAEAWGLQNWLNDAQQRSQRFYQQGPQGPVTWVLVEGKNIPQGALLGGSEKSGELFIARAYCEGGVHPGKAFRHSRKGAVTSFGGKEYEFDKYEVLLGNQNSIRWVSGHGKLSVGNLGATPVEGGRDRDGSILYVGKCPYKGGEHCGKVSERLDGCCIAYGDDEVLVKEWQILCYA